MGDCSFHTEKKNKIYVNIIAYFCETCANIDSASMKISLKFDWIEEHSNKELLI